jgi:integrase
LDRKTSPGLIKRGDTWYIQKRIGNGRRIRESCGTDNVEEAERYLARRNEEIRNAQLYGIRPKRPFAEAALKYLAEEEKASLEKDHWALKRIEPFIGQLPLENVHMGTLRPYIEHGKAQGWKNRTINMPLEVVWRILNLAAGEWLDEHGLTWLQSPPKIRLLARSDAREPYPLSWKEQTALFEKLPAYLRRMCLFAVNTGCRDQEICKLRWDYEIDVPAFQTSVFIVPKERVKNRQDRLIVLNSVVKAVIEEVRGENEEWVFTYKGHPISTMNTPAWKEVRTKAGIPVRIHDLKHTYGRRLRAAGVSFEDRQDLLGHKSGRITTHYSAPELRNLIEASEKICEMADQGGPKMDPSVFLRKKNPLKLVANSKG